MLMDAVHASLEPALFSASSICAYSRETKSTADWRGLRRTEN